MPSTRRRYLRRAGRVGGALTAALLSGCSNPVASGSEGAKTPVHVGSKPFTEQRILGYLAYERLRTVDGVRAIDGIGSGDSLANWEATASGDKDLYWEYTGTAWAQLPPRHDERVTDPDRLYEQVRADAETRGIHTAEPAAFSNEYVVVADRTWVEETGVTTLGGLAEYLDGEAALGVAVNEEFYHRQDGWNGLLDYYGVGADAKTALESEPFVVTSTGLTYELLKRADIRLASGFATDPQLERPSFVVLDDDRDYFLPYQPMPTAHTPTVEARPRILEVLTPVVESLDEATMRRLNRRVLIDERHPNAVAKAHLRSLEGRDA
ncbi:glycine betaine ABC transporter substrate-binding protein [Natronomonas amylolytica]|uniref:ABC transporter substrate-binding protein n=1 Tax=Natronomonas amylolytica TaxID=3108498 RepID=UPI0030080E77